MLIKFHQLINTFNPTITGILHVGAHNCEEKSDYNRCNIKDDDIYWIDAMPDKIKRNKELYGNNLHIYQGVIDEVNDKLVDFHITNNGASSSILEFGSHSSHHPHVKVTDTIKFNTIRLDSLIEKYNIPIEKLNFINLDIQGVELRALKSMGKYLQHVKYIYTEVNTEEVYKNCDQIQDIDSYLNQFGFKRMATNIFKQYGWGDAFYIKM